LNTATCPAYLPWGLIVTGPVYLRNLIATRTVDVNGAQITGQLACARAKLDGKTGPDTWGRALNAQGVTVRASLYLRNLIATGTVVVAGAQIVGQLSCTGAKLDVKTGPDTWGRALSAQGVTVGESLFLSNLTATGTVDVNAAHIDGQLDCTGASLDGKGATAPNAYRMEVKQGFFWCQIKQTLGQITLANATVGDLTDDMASWPDDIILDGFTYDRISAAPTDARPRRNWLRKGASRGGAVFPQPYTQLASVLSQMGHDRAARKIPMARERALAEDHLAQDQARYQRLRNVTDPGERGDAGWVWLAMHSARFWSQLIRFVAGYGYAPERALYCGLVLWAFSTVVYFLA